MDLSILIVSFNTSALLKESLVSICTGKNGSECEVLVIDNHSSDGSPEMVRENFPEVRVIANEKNLGFARGVNRGIEESSGRYILILNADTVLPEDGIPTLLAFADEEYRNRRAGIVGVRLLNADGSLQYSKGRFPTISRTLADALRPKPRRKYTYSEYDVPGETDWVTGACLLVRRELLEDLGNLDENFFLYYEDVDLCWRAHQKGWKVVYYPGFEVRHCNPYCRRNEPREFVPVEIRRSHLYFYRKNYSSLSFSALWLLTFAYAAGRVASSMIPFLGANGKRTQNGRVARRIIKEALLNGHANGKEAHRPGDAG
ncbi:MAG: glycosyltransferase family 2 protein [Planctomycetota bacterium]